MNFDKEKIRVKLEQILRENSERKLLALLKENSFLFSDIYSRQYGIQPNFAEVPFGTKHRCDFCWLNDNSDGPEWVLVEIEKPEITLFNKGGDPSAELNHAIEQVRAWDRYFSTNPNEKSRIFGAVSKFRYVLVVGSKEAWESNSAALWKSHFNNTNNIEIRSTDTFIKSINRFHEDPRYFSFEQYPHSWGSSKLSDYCNSYQYILHWKNVLASNA
jgi:hypothetical protein